MTCNDGITVQQFKASNDPKTDPQICKYCMSYITEWTQQTRPDTVADKHNQNINLLCYNKYRGAQAVSNAYNKGKFQLTNNNTTNLWIPQVEILSNKMALASWLLLFKTAENTGVSFPQNISLSQWHIKTLWTLNKDLFRLQSF